MSLIALNGQLNLLTPFLQNPLITDICINQPGEINVYKNNQFETYPLPELSLNYLKTLICLIAEYNQKEITFERPLLAGSLPTGERIQIIIPPACEKDKIIIAIRRYRLHDMSLNDYESNGAFLELNKNENNNEVENLKSLYQEKEYKNFLEQAILAKQNILISAGTGIGKTTFLNACLKSIPANERLITIEDTREVIVTQPHVVHLLANRNKNDNTHSMQDLFEASLRLRPDRIILSEIRGQEAFSYLRAINSGHPGSLSTIHADSPQAAIEQLIFMMQQANTQLSENYLLNYIRSTVPIIVQLKRDPSQNRYMYVSDITFNAMAGSL